MSLPEYLSQKLNVPTSFIESSIRMAPRAYKKFYIPKRNTDKPRAVYQPAKKIKALQRIIIKDFLEKLPIHDAVFSYRHNISTIDNANIHKRCKYLLRIDFENFFESITRRDIFKFLIENREIFPENFSEEDIKLISHLASFYDEESDSYRLVIGSPMSPIISNAILNRHDKEINQYCENLGIRYSRYADDLFFSTSEKNVLGDTPRAISEIIKKLKSPHLKINIKKTIHTSKKHNMRITGVVLTPTGDTSIGRERKREIKALIHKLSIGQLPIEKKPYLSGLLAYVNSIEPSFIQRLKEKYGPGVLDLVKATQD